jgi:hypothetical protein
VAARDWATWHPITCQPKTTCQHLIRRLQPIIACHIITCRTPCQPCLSSPRRKSYCHVCCVSLSIRQSPCHVTCHTMLMSSRATCHPSSGDTCHLGIGPTVCPKCQNCLTRVTAGGCHVSCTDLPRVIVWTCHMSSYGPATCPVRTDTCPVRTVRTGTVSIQKFCLFGLADRMRYLLHTDSV